MYCHLSKLLHPNLLSGFLDILKVVEEGEGVADHQVSFDLANRSGSADNSLKSY